MSPEIKGFYDPGSHTISYVLSDPATRKCAIIDPVLDYDPPSGRVSSVSADVLAQYVQEQGLSLQWILETHAHADHMSAAQWLKKTLGGELGIGENIRVVQTHFAPLFGMEPAFQADGSQFDRLFKNNDEIQVGNLVLRILHTPGHTPACLSYLVEDCIFVGDTLFMPDYGTARADFPGGDARQLYRSIRRILDFPPRTRLFMCHDYRPGGREPRWECTVEQQRVLNPWVRDGVTESQFVERRLKRDRELKVPALILPSLQVNIRAGHLPGAADNGISYLKIPLNQLGPSS